MPRTVQTLYLATQFTHSLNGLPDALIDLDIDCAINEVAILPPNLQSLKILAKFSTLPVLPSTLTELQINSYESLHVDYPYGMFPDSLRALDWNGLGGISLAQVPVNIQKLCLWDNYVEPVEDFSRFHKLTEIIFPDAFNLAIDGLLPPQLQYVSELTFSFIEFSIPF